MTHDDLLAYCLAKPGAWRDEPWEETVVAKVDEKIFCFVGERSIGVHCGSRLEADEWLMRHPEDAAPMSHIGRWGWNTLQVGAGISDREILQAIDDSYFIVVLKLPSKRRPDGWDRVGV